MTLIRIILTLLAVALAVPGVSTADDLPAYAPITITTEQISDYLWKAYPLVIFADTPDDPMFRQQMEQINVGLDDLKRRGVVILTDTDPAAQTAIRTTLRPHGFALVLIGLDGQVQLRKPAPWHVREIVRAIDKGE